MLHSNTTFIHPTSRLNQGIPVDTYRYLFVLPETYQKDLIRLYNHYLVFGESIKDQELGQLFRRILKSCSYQYCRFYELEKDEICLNIGKFYSVDRQQDRVQTECCIHTWNNSREFYCDNCNDKFTNSNRRKGKGDDGIHPSDGSFPSIVVYNKEGKK